MPERAKAESQMTLASRRSASDERQGGWFSRRSRLERYLLLACTTVLFIVVGLCIALAAAIMHGPKDEIYPSLVPPPAALTAEGKEGVCMTKACVSTAAQLINAMDEAVDPCDDFFKFACGGFLKKTIIPDDKATVSRFLEISDELQQKLRTLAMAEVEENEPKFSKMIKNLYTSCMDTNAIKEQGLTPLKEILTLMGGWPVLEGPNWNAAAYEWTQNVYKNRLLGFSVDYLFDFSVTINIKNSTSRIIDLDQSPLGMPSRKYLLKGYNSSDVQAYYKYQVETAVLLGADRTVAEEELRESLLFEIQIANFSLPKEERRNASKLYNKMTIAELQTLAPQVPWLDYINTLLHPFFSVTNEEPVVVNVPSYVKNMALMLSTTPKRVIANYMMWRATAASLGYLTEEGRNIQLEYSKKITGKGTREPRWKECMGTITRSLSHGVGSMYARKFFNEEAKLAADTMVAYIRAEFDNILMTLDWMDETTRTQALRKSKAITPHIAYPPELLNDTKLLELYDGLEISTGTLLNNMRNLTVFGTDYSFKRLREPVDKKDWRRHGSAAVVNAFYSPLENSIQFPAGILQGVFFEADRPKYMNFGGIGYVIGHEITHGFDDSGRQFDEKGDLRDWWDEGTKTRFLEKAQCIIDQYGNYTVPEVGLNLNGINTQGENIADNGGIKEAYLAYQKWVLDNHREDKLPSLPYNPNQLFWISAANVWCSVYRPETLKLRILTGNHSPAQFRINGPFGNRPEFARDWNCPSGSKLNPLHRCSVW